MGVQNFESNIDLISKKTIKIKGYQVINLIA